MSRRAAREAAGEHEVADDERLRWGDDFRRETGRDDAGTRSLDGIRIAPLYTTADAPPEPASPPGQFPYTRGIRASMYLGRPWTLRQYAGFSTAAESNAAYRRALAEGQRALSVAFDLPTHRGYDSDDPHVAGDVGKAGVAIDSVEDMAALFDGIPLDRTSVSMTMNGAVLPCLAFFIVAAEEQGVSPERLQGTIQNDILKEFLVRNTYIYPPGPSMRIVADVIAYAARAMPKFNSVSISGYHMHEAGATPAQELAFTLADGLDYVRAALARGLDIDAFAGRLSFFFAIGMDVFGEVAKLRAARMLWAQQMRALGARDERSLQMRMHCQTSGVSLTEQNPYNNVVRTTIEALAGVLGGTQSLHTNSFDEAHALPTEAAARIARDTQLIVQHETGVTNVVDPLGGSYYVEALTTEVAAAASTLIAEIERAGGMTAAIAAGLPSRLIDESALRRQARSDRGDDVVVGVERKDVARAATVDVRHVDTAAVAREQRARLVALRARRDPGAVHEALAALRGGAATDANLLELAIVAARARCTVGEISGALETVFGRHAQAQVLRPGVYRSVVANDPAYDVAAKAVSALTARLGRAPRLLVAKLGQDGHDRGMKVIGSAFADCGFDVHLAPLFETPHQLARRAEAADVDVVGVSSLAAGHGELLPSLIAEMTALRSRATMVVGGIVPDAERTVLRALGVAEFFAPSTRALDCVVRVLRVLECPNPDKLVAPPRRATNVSR